MKSFIITLDEQGNFHLVERTCPPKGFDTTENFAAGRLSDADGEVSVGLTEYGAKRAPLERRRLITLAVRNLFRLLRS